MVVALMEGMMIIALLHDHFDASHLVDVTAEMQTRGAPEIRAVWLEGHAVWAAIEGCHRLRAAHALGLRPVIIPVEYSETVTVGDLGLDADCRGDDTVADLVDRCYEREWLTWEDED